MVSQKIDPIKSAQKKSAPDYVRDLDDVFDPVKIKALAKKLNLTEDAILDRLQTIAAEIENQKMVDEEPCHLHPDNLKLVDKQSTVEINKFYLESVDQYVLEERAIETEIETMTASKPTSELEDIASTLALTEDIYRDASTGVFDVAKLTELLAKQPQGLNRGSGGYIGRTPADDEQERHNRRVEEGLEKLIELAKKQANPSVNQWNHTKTATKEDLDKAQKEIADKNKTIADMLDRDRRMRESNLPNYKAATRYMMKVGQPAYEDYCKRTLVGNKKSEVNASEHLRQFHKDMSEWMDDSAKEVSVDMKLKRPTSESAWRTMQARVLQKLGIIATGK
jgi:hypothetical protein